MWRETDSDKELYTSIGRVAVQASIFERQLHFIYWHYAGLTRSVGPVITESLRPQRLMADILKIARETNAGAGRVADLEDIASIYGGVAQQRNEIMHWMWLRQSEDGSHELLVPPYMRSKKGGDKSYTIADINAVAESFYRLIGRTVAHTLSDEAILAARPQMAKMHPELKGRPFAPAPWLDTHR